MSQKEIAFLLGCQSGAKVSRYEDFASTPPLATALMLEIIFAVPTKDLFAGTYQEDQRVVTTRARRLVRKLKRVEGDSATSKLRVLEAIITGQTGPVTQLR